MPRTDAFGYPIAEPVYSGNDAIYDMLSTPPTPTPTQSKQDRLQARTADKVAKLGITATAAQLQQGLSDAVDAQVFTRPDGSKYTIDYQPAVDRFGEATVNPVEVPFIDVNKYGTADTRNLYIDDTLQGNMKLGLAGQGFEKRYDANYKYGEAPGPRGVTVNDGALMDIELPYNAASQFEYDVHTNQGQVANRAATRFNKNEFGDGYSEYTTQEAPLWSGKDTNRFDKYIAYDKTSSAAQPDAQYIQPDAGLRPLTYNKVDGGTTSKRETPSQAYARLNSGIDTTTSDDRVTNLVDGLQFSAGRLAAEVADSFVDAATRLVKSGVKEYKGLSEKEANSAMLKDLTFSKDWFDKDMNFTALDKYKDAKEYGYATSRTQKATEGFGKAYDSGNALEMAKALGTGIIDAGPEFVIESAAYMLATANPLLLTLTAAGQSNEFIEEIQKNLGTTDVGYARRLGALAASAAVMGLEKVGVDELVGNTKFVKDLVGAAVNSGSKNTAINTLKALGKKALTVTGTAGYEGLTEAVQEGLQAFTEKYDTKVEKELYDGTLGKEMFQAFGGGFGAGASISGARETVSPVVDAVTSAADKVAEGAGKVLPKNKPKDTVKAVTAANPNLDAKEVAKVTTEMTATDSLSTVAEDELVEAPVAVKEVNKDVGLAVAKQLDVDEGTVLETEETTKASSENSPELNGALEQFDGNYQASLDLLRGPVTNVAKATEAFEEAGLPVSEEVRAVEGKIQGGSAQLVQTLLESRGAAVKAGAGPKQIAKMDAKIARLIPFTVATSPVELKAVLDSNDVKEKVRNVIGSSAASYDDIGSVITEAEKEGSGVSKAAIDLMKFKGEVLKNFKHVSGEKLVGGGSKPGAIQWAELLISGGYNEAAARNINAFIAGQNSKQQAFVDAIAKWDADNKMPWTPEGKGHPAASKGRGFFTDSNKGSYRSAAIKDDKASPEVIVNYGPLSKGSKTTYGSVHKATGVLEAITTERKTMDMLTDLVNEYSPAEVDTETSPEAQEGTQEAQSTEKGAVSPVEPKKPSDKAIDDMSIGEVRREILALDNTSETRALYPEEFSRYAALKTRESELVTASESTKPDVEEVTEKPVKAPTKPKVVIEDKVVEEEVTEAPVEAEAPMKTSQEESPDLTEEDAVELQRMRDEEQSQNTPIKKEQVKVLRDKDAIIAEIKNSRDLALGSISQKGVLNEVSKLLKDCGV